MQAGAREYLIKPFSHDELVAAIRRVHQLEEKKGTFARAAAPDSSGAPRAAALGEVIVLFSGKGGVGKTLLATNLSVALAVETESRVALVDLDLQFGDIGVMLNLDHSRSITDVVESDTLEPEMLNEIMAHGPSGVRVLLAPISPELADLITSDHVRMVMTELRKTYDYVVVDTSCHLADFNLEVIEAAQHILVVTALTIPAIKDAKLALKVLESQGKKVNFLQCRLMRPFPAKAVGDILRGAKHIVSMEENYSGQLAQVVQEQTGVMIDQRINKFDGRPFSEDEVVNALAKVYEGAKAEPVVTHVH